MGAIDWHHALQVMQIMVIATANNMVFKNNFSLHRSKRRGNNLQSQLTLESGCLVRPVPTDTKKTGYLCLENDFSCTSMEVKNDCPPGRLKSVYVAAVKWDVL